MKLYSTNDKTHFVDLKTAIFNSLSKDKGLYMPDKIPRISQDVLEQIESFTFQEIANEVAHTLIGDEISPMDLKGIIEKAINFSAPIIPLSRDIFSLELWHGPSLAFKDFGARFMAEIMRHFNESSRDNRTILVATSGDTGGAVAQGFYQVPGIEVIILYPSGKVSDLQERQLTTLGDNITALEIQGTFDDCQAIVKRAFLDENLNKSYKLSSANSINIARLIPQMFYYFEAYRQIEDKGRPLVFSVPSGNFGNLTAGIMSHKMGLPIHRFLAATNINNIVPHYLATGIYKPKNSVQTLSNAMDVGDPSNFVRMVDLFNGKLTSMQSLLSGYYYDDNQTLKAMRSIMDKYNYVSEPHGAIAFLALEEFLNQNRNCQGIFLETAHPAKFLDVMQKAKIEVVIPQRLLDIAKLKKESILMSTDYNDFYNWMISRAK